MFLLINVYLVISRPILNIETTCGSSWTSARMSGEFEAVGTYDGIAIYAKTERFSQNEWWFLYYNTLKSKKMWPGWIFDKTTDRRISTNYNLWGLGENPIKPYQKDSPGSYEQV